MEVKFLLLRDGAEGRLKEKTKTEGQKRFPGSVYNVCMVLFICARVYLRQRRGHPAQGVGILTAYGQNILAM